MKLTEYFQLSLEDREAREKARSILFPKEKEETKEYSLEDYYEIGDTDCRLTRLRAFQLADILGKWKIF